MSADLSVFATYPALAVFVGGGILVILAFFTYHITVGVVECIARLVHALMFGRRGTK